MCLVSVGEVQRFEFLCIKVLRGGVATFDGGGGREPICGDLCESIIPSPRKLRLEDQELRPTWVM